MGHPLPLPHNGLLTTAYLGGISPHLEISYDKGAHVGARHSTGAAKRQVSVHQEVVAREQMKSGKLVATDI